MTPGADVPTFSTPAPEATVAVEEARFMPVAHLAVGHVAAGVSNVSATITVPDGFTGPEVAAGSMSRFQRPPPHTCGIRPTLPLICR